MILKITIANDGLHSVGKWIGMWVAKSPYVASIL